MKELLSVVNKIKQVIEKTREEKRDLEEYLNELLIDLGATQEELDSEWVKASVIKRLCALDNPKDVKELLTVYTRMCQKRRKITTLNEVLSYILK